ncbi:MULTISPECIES: lasso peptide biosynthesis B2 protein [Alphaproteobacteria]|jgi:hypothetical protein|uniref:lasso peptide biosynthesis B2 protein n=1 Tax=Alphaproteobacteria TaxID=28211 RepID=UPI001AE9C708|nr:lasso peptide biosynthesis B2 protein [Sphingomonas sp. BE137]MDR6849921.1 hypothetical protein [Sphingomonas sp. BE137]
MDLDSRRYSTLPAQLCGPFVAFMAGEQAIPQTDVDRLIALRVIQPGTGTHQPREILPLPTHEIMPARQASSTVVALAAQGVATWQVRSISLRRLLTDEAARRPSDHQDANEQDLGRLRRAFERIASLFGEANECLPRSLAFRRLALRYGHRPSLVIGVKINPFGAHCWVQSGARVDNDSLERVRLFTPIHVV